MSDHGTARGDGAARQHALVEIRGGRREFGAGEARVAALGGIDFELNEGEYVAIRGVSGSGKSTLLQIIGMLDRMTAGSYRYRGSDARAIPEREVARIRNEEIGFVFQAFHLLADRSALDNVALPLAYRRGGVAPHDPRAMLERVGLAARLRHRPGQLSGGECQRVAIARALVKRPRMILLDEPTGNLDSQTSRDLLDLIDGIHREERPALLIVTHDEQIALRAERVLTMRDGRWTD
ncbi:MAG: ABC transporter ATP-binding protein [Planctomycetes bacterium]|nr:ABC transporter ATP-binding protein [Planctomycetota bacterium]